MPRERIEEIEGKEFRIVHLPPDPRLQPARVKKRQLFQALSAKEKKKVIAESVRKSRKRRRKKRSRDGQTQG